MPNEALQQSAALATTCGRLNQETGSCCKAEATEKGIEGREACHDRGVQAELPMHASLRHPIPRIPHGAACPESPRRMRVGPVFPAQLCDFIACSHAWRDYHGAAVG